MRIKYFQCWSINLLRFISKHNIHPIDKYIDKNKGKSCWIYILNDDLQKTIDTYTQTKNEQLSKV